MNAPDTFIRLDFLPPNTCGIVHDIQIDDDETRRLKALGVCSGHHVELVRGGDPLILKVFGSRLGLSAALAARVQIKICQPDQCELQKNFQA